MKIETPPGFDEWFRVYQRTANYYVAASEKDEQQRHALWLCLRDAFAANRPDPRANPVVNYSDGF